MPAKVSSMTTSAAKKGSEKGDKKKKKKKKKALNAAQSLRMNELQTRIYEASLLGKHIHESDKREDYVTDITEKELDKEQEKYSTSLARLCGHLDLVKEFCETKEWQREEKWKEESAEYQKAKYRAELYAVDVEGNLSDADETSEEEE